MSSHGKKTAINLTKIFVKPNFKTWNLISFISSKEISKRQRTDCLSHLVSFILERCTPKYCIKQTIGFFVFITNLTFLYKIDIEGFKKFQQKIKLPPVGFELTTAAITGLEFQLSYPLSHQVIC